MTRRLPRVLLFAVLILPAAAAARGDSRDAVKVKVALISRCLQYVGWPDSSGLKEIRIGLLGADRETAEAFGEMARNVSLGGRTVRIAAVAGVESIKGVEALYVDASLAGQAPRLWRAIEKRRIFLVTDRFPDKKYVMLNMAMDPEQTRLTFEINRANAVIEGFIINPELLLLGGTEIDVRALYRKMRDDLIRQEEDMRRKQILLERLGGQVDSLRRKMDQYAGTIAGMEAVIQESRKHIAGQEDEQRRLAGEISGKSRELDRQIRVLKGQQAEIESQQADIARIRGEVATLNADLAAKEGLLQAGRERIGAQEDALRRLGARLGIQRTLLFFMAASTLLLLALGAAVYMAYRIKRAAAETLEENVRKRTEELETAFRKQRDLEATLQQTEKLKSIGQLAGGIAHDFNNQLGGILGFADLLRDKLADRPQLRDFAETIITLVGRSRDLTSQLLAFARKGQYQSVAVDMRALVQEVLALLDRTMSKDIRIRSDFCTGSACVMGDPSLLQNAILNLAINARDAMPDGGELLLGTAVEDVPADRDGTHGGGGRFVRVSVKDTGCGMDRETVKRIFEPFFTTKEVGKGTGMGLAAVLGTIQTHHGFIEVDSAPGGGSEFRLYLPLSQEAKTGVAAGRDLQAPQGLAKRIRILLVDDEEVMRELALSIFQDMGHALTVCKGGYSALDFYADNWRNIDLVILDMIMPAMNGKELFARLKSVNPDVVAILVSGYSTSSDVQDLLADGMRGFIPKPYGKSEMSRIIGEIFSLTPI